jgi:hypothetical protein
MFRFFEQQQQSFVNEFIFLDLVNVKNTRKRKQLIISNKCTGFKMLIASGFLNFS